MRKFLFFLLLNFAQGSAAIYVFGDSHSRTFEGIPETKIQYLSGRTMHRIGRDGFNALDLNHFDIQAKDTAVFIFGEIDVRCHIGKQRDLKNRDTEEILQTLVTKYLQTILFNQLFFPDLTYIVCSITPPTDRIFNPEYPRYGSLTDRVMFTKRLNTILKALCESYDIKFLDIYDDFADEQGELIEELSDGNVHINSNSNGPIRKKLCKLINK